MTMIRNTYIPDDVINRILPLLNTKGLGRIQQVNKHFNLLAGNDVLWQALFLRVWNLEVPKGMLGKEALQKSIIKNGDELRNKLVTFFCRQKWEKKTRLECTFPNDSISADKREWSNQIINSMCPSATVPTAVFEIGFGPRRGTHRGFNSAPADETKYLHFIGNINELLNAGGVLSLCGSKNIGNSPLFTSFQSPIPLSDAMVFDHHFVANIEKLDVGYGNSLGYFSSINHWAEPFELFCVQGSNGIPKWTGRIPYSEFKFVKIDPNRNITWENIGQNRQWSPRRSGRPHSWNEYLQKFPIRF